MLVDERSDVEDRAGRAVKVGEAALGDRAIACDIDDLAVTEGHVFLDVERSLVPLDLDEARGVDREIEAVAAPLAMVLDRGTVGMGLAERIAPGDAKIVSRLEGERRVHAGTRGLAEQIGRAHVCTPVTNEHPVCRRLCVTTQTTLDNNSSNSQ